MKKKLILPAAAMSLVLVFTACSKAAVPEDTSDATSESAAQTTTVETTAEETTTETSEEGSAALDYTFNPHCLSSIYIDKYGEDFRENFFRYCDAVIAGEDSVKLDDEEYMTLFWEISRCCLPIANRYVVNPWDSDIEMVGDGEYRLEYILPKDEYLNEVERFKDRGEYLIESVCLEDDTPLEKTLALYREESFRLDYDYAALEDNYVDPDGCGVCPYRALMTDHGICQEIAGAYAFLLLQVGVDATVCSGLTKDVSAAHEWTVVKIGDNFYHCDVTFQCSDDKYSLRYFGMNDAERELEGDWDLECNNYGCTNDIHHEDLIIEDTRFEPVWSCVTYDLDREENMLYCYGWNENGESTSFEMSLGDV